MVEARTRHITFLLDDVHGVHNLAAVVRSCDAWGIADLHCIVSGAAGVAQSRLKALPEGDARVDRERFYRGGGDLKELFERESARRVSKGTDKWVAVEEYGGGAEAVARLKEKGYAICVSSLSADALPLGEVELAEKVCFVFGNEHSGVSDAVAEMADVQFTIPMYGFVESCNISVAAATVASHVVERARRSQEARFLEGTYFLSSEEQRAMYHKFLVPKVPAKRHNSHEKLRSRYDVTRLGSHVERRVAKQGFFKPPQEDVVGPASKMLEESLRLGDTGALVSRYFTRRAKIGALGDSGKQGYAKRSNSIVDGVAGISALSCESAVSGIHSGEGDDGKSKVAAPLFGQRQRLAPLFREATEAVNSDYAPLFDASGYPAFPPFAPETEIRFRDVRTRCYSHAWKFACDYFASIGDDEGEEQWSAARLKGLLERVDRMEIARILASTMHASSKVTSALGDVAESLSNETVLEMTKFVTSREPMRDSFVVSRFTNCAVENGSGDKQRGTGLTKQELAALHILVRLAQCVNVVSMLHQCAWEKETTRGSRLIQANSFGLVEMLLVDATADMKLLGADDKMKEMRCFYEIMCLVDRLREAAAEDMDRQVQERN